ncbi:MAG: alpha/beta fold hydrolase [Betaproteobacteria bacterium]|nr:alpha/beta fold hydrolase [Betaproteobacteria bacterium]
MDFFFIVWRSAAVALGLLLLSFSGAGVSQELPRQADWQFSLSARSGAITIASVQAGSPAEQAGMLAGDRVVSINGQPVRSGLDAFRARQQSKAGRDLSVNVERNGRSVELKFRPRALAFESHPGIEVRRASARTAAGFDVQMVVTRPEGAAKLPVVVFIPWLSCDPVENPAGPQDGWGRMLLDLVRESGWAVIRVEKAGLGDSTGPLCVDADLEADLAGFRAALGAVSAMPGIDRERIFLFGGSIGASLAPLLARETALKGIVVSGGFYKTWLEHMLEFERNRLAFIGRTPGEINEAMRGYAEFQVLYLNGRVSPGEVIGRRPEFKALWSESPTHQYGRPARYFHQLQALNIAAAWDAVQVPVLVVYGEYDWIMSLDDQKRIVDTVNGRRPGNARLIVVPRMNHHFEVFDSPAAAFADEGGRYTPSPVRDIMRWMREQAR